jgi:Ni/Co efflux regulator RcnB
VVSVEDVARGVVSSPRSAYQVNGPEWHCSLELIFCVNVQRKYSGWCRRRITRRVTTTRLAVCVPTRCIRWNHRQHRETDTDTEWQRDRERDKQTHKRVRDKDIETHRHRHREWQREREWQRARERDKHKHRHKRVRDKGRERDR